MAQGVNPHEQFISPMGKPHKTNIKRRRRKLYLKRKNEQKKANIARKDSAPAKKAVKKTAAKKVAKKAAAKKVAKKAAAKKVAKKAATKKTATKKTAAKKAAPKKDEE